MAQFSALEQMQNMSVAVGSLADRQALNLVGKFVAGTEAETGETVSGVARALFYEEGQAFLEVSGKAIALKDIKMISQPEQVRQEFGGQAPTGPLAPAKATPADPVAPAAPEEVPPGPSSWRLRNFQRTLDALEST